MRAGHGQGEEAGCHHGAGRAQFNAEAAGCGHMSQLRAQCLDLHAKGANEEKSGTTLLDAKENAR